jgi:hypothetical protein
VQTHGHSLAHRHSPSPGLGVKATAASALFEGDGWVNWSGLATLFGPVGRDFDARVTRLLGWANTLDQAEVSIKTSRMNISGNEASSRT